MTLQKPEYGEYTSYLLLPIALPLVLAFVLPAARWRGKTLTRGLLLVFLASMLVSVLQLQWFGIRAMFGGFLAIPPITVPFFFLLPLCQTFLDAMAAGRRALDERSNLGGYIGLGYLFFLPLVTFMLHLLATLIFGIVAVRKGDAWFA